MYRGLLARSGFSSGKLLDHPLGEAKALLESVVLRLCWFPAGFRADGPLQSTLQRTAETRAWAWRQ